MQHPTSTRTPLIRAALTLLTLLALVGLSLGAVASDKSTDWKAQDARGEEVDTTAYRGKVLLVFINHPDTRDKMKPLTNEMVLKYGHNPEVAQLTLVDLRALEFYKRPFARDHIVEAAERTAERIEALLKEHNQPPIPRLKKRLNIVPDFEGELLARYTYWNTSEHVTVVVINKQGDVVGSWKGEQLEEIHEAVSASLIE